MAANSEIIFGAAKIRIGDVGATLTDTANGIFDVQDFSIESSSEEKALYTSAWINAFKETVAFYSSDLKIKFSTKDIERDLLRRIMGASLTAGSSSTPDVLTIGKTSKPSFFRLEADLQSNDSTPRAINIVVFKAYAKGLPLAFKIDDFADITLEISVLPDPATGNVATISMAQ